MARTCATQALSGIRCLGVSRYRRSPRVAHAAGSSGTVRGGCVDMSRDLGTTRLMPDASGLLPCFAPDRDEDRQAVSNRRELDLCREILPGRQIPPAGFVRWKLQGRERMRMSGVP